MTLTPEIKTDRATVYRSTWRELAATLPDNMPEASLAIVDGPYNMKKAAWDTFKSWEHFVAWYRPELEELSRVLAETANVYLWGTDTSASALRPLMAELGWRRRTRVIWDKVTPPLTLPLSSWPDVTEVCDHYQRGEPTFTQPEHSPRRATGPHIPAITCIWRMAPGAYVRERIKGGRGLNRDGSEVDLSLHPCQKPLAFYDRLIRSSSRVGDTVLEPYGGTLRAAVACQRLPPSEARRAIVCEPHGPYIEAVRPSLEFVPVGSNGQPSLFG